MAKPESCNAEPEHGSGLGKWVSKHLKFSIANFQFKICNASQSFHSSNPPTGPLRFSKLQRASTYRNERGAEPRSSFLNLPFVLCRLSFVLRLACIFARRCVSYSMPKTIRVQVPGSTSNLGAGFDALGLAVELYLQVAFHFDTRRTYILSTHGEGAHEIAHSADHLILQTFQYACQELKHTPPHVALEINNAIPLKRGLGSSGAAIVAGLLAAHAYFDHALSQQQLLDFANELEGHPENASASLLGGLTVNGVHNSRVLCERFAPPANWKAACFVPDLEIATEDARRVLPASLSRAHAIGNSQSAAMMVAAFAKQNAALLEFAARDYLHQPFRKVLIPGFDDILAAAMRAEAYCAFLSGSGSTMLAIAEDKHAEEISNTMAAAARMHGLSGRPMTLAFCTQAAQYEVI